MDKVDPYINNFHSINGLAGDPVADKELQLKITTFNDDSIEIEIKNRNYWKQCMLNLKLLLSVLTTYTAYYVLMYKNYHKSFNSIDIGFLMSLLYLLWATFQLVNRGWYI